MMDDKATSEITMERGTTIATASATTAAAPGGVTNSASSSSPPTATMMERGTTVATAAASNALAPRRATNSSYSSSSLPKRLKMSDLNTTFRSLVEDISRNDLLQHHLRETWETDPKGIEDRKQHLCVMENPKYVGLTDKPSELVEKLGPCSRERPSLGMVNACSGSGKSALLQYCERTINHKDWNILALAVTFNQTGGDGKLLEPVEGLAMRLAERFLINRGEDDEYGASIFESFRSLWLQNKYHKSLDLASVLSAIQSFLHKAKTSRMIFVFVDEPGLAGSSSRSGVGTKPWIAKDLVDSTSQFRHFDGNVRFVFSSLKPIYEQDTMIKVTQTGGPIVWIDIPPVSPKKKMRRELQTRLTPLEKRMSQRDYDLASELAIVMASGHWATFDGIAKNLDVSSFEEESKHDPGSRNHLKWFSSVYYENVRDVIVQTTYNSSSLRSIDIPKTYKILLMLAVLGHPVHPFGDEFFFDYNQSELKDLKIFSVATLNDMAYCRLIQNRIRASDDSSFFYKQVPHLSLLDIRRLCLSLPEDTFCKTIRDVLYSAGHDPTKEPKADRPPAGIAFEKITMAFRQAKFWSWRELSSNEMFGVQTKITLTEFFSEYKFLVNNHRDYGMKVPNDEPRRLYISGKQGFRFKPKKVPPKKADNESDEQYQDRKSLWFKKALRELTFDAPCSGVDLHNGDILCPGSKNQPLSDAIYVIEWASADGKGDTVAPGLIFDQCKYSEGNSSTGIGCDDFIKGLKNVIKERGLLYNVDPENLQCGNQISALDVKEENIVYCWSVLRKTTDSLEDSVREKAQQLGFKGSIIITDNKDDPTNMFGETFKDLAHLHRSVYF